MLLGRFLAGILCVVASCACAQFGFVLDQTIPVDGGNGTLSLPWAGGLNSPQFNTIDINGDGQDDLVLFDRNANKLLTFISHNKTYQYAPEYESQFPSAISSWVLFRDFNCDGKKDIFTSDPFGMKAWVNITQGSGPLQWRKFNPNFPVLTYGFSGPINLQVNSSDIPAIDDIDGDGDLDVLDARFVGIGSLEFHRNMSIENTGTCDSMEFKRITQTWGNFEECNCGNYIFGPGSCSTGGRVAHAAGKTSLTLDLDNDGDRDLLFSEENCTKLYLLSNSGTADSAIITGFTEFPSISSPVNMQIFPAPYFEDIDFDGVSDLVIASNIPTRNSYAIDFNHTVWLYRNTGTNQSPMFSLIEDNFMQNRMIDIGDNAVPAFFDEDGDGDLDLFIGQYLGYNAYAGLTFFENTGTTNSPSYQLVTTDYGDLPSHGFYGLQPQFADMNADGKVDLAFTATDYQTGTTSLRYLANQSSTGLDIASSEIVDTHFNLASSENLLVVDINKDGKQDILLGRSVGSVEYWINIGPAGSWSMSLEDPAFVGIDVSTSRQSLAIAVGDVNADGQRDLVVGDQKGIITIYGDIDAQQTPEGVTDIIYNPLSDTYASVNLGGHVWPVLANIFNTDKPSIIVGNTLGGLHVLKNDNGNILPPDPVVNLYPNPLPKGNSFTITADREVVVQFVTLLGQRASEEFTIPAYQSIQVTPQWMSSGVYVARITSKGKTYSRRLVIY